VIASSLGGIIRRKTDKVNCPLGLGKEDVKHVLCK
jgi:hypothetical protein